jgi:predicted transcriptional regulator
MELETGRVAESKRRRERLDWLVGLCLLPRRAESLLAILMGEGSLTTAALAARLGVDETTVAAELTSAAPLSQWGLVRRRGQHVSVNVRIARFLLDA